MNTRAVCFNTVDTGMRVLGLCMTAAPLLRCLMSCFCNVFCFFLVFFSFCGGGGVRGSQLHTTHPTAPATFQLQERKTSPCVFQTVSFLFKARIPPEAFYLVSSLILFACNGTGFYMRVTPRQSNKQTQGSAASFPMDLSLLFGRRGHWRSAPLGPGSAGELAQDVTEGEHARGTRQHSEDGEWPRGSVYPLCLITLECVQE